MCRGLCALRQEFQDVVLLDNELKKSNSRQMPSCWMDTRDCSDLVSWFFKSLLVVRVFGSSSNHSLNLVAYSICGHATRSVQRH